MFELFVLGKTEINWDKYLSMASACLKRNPTAGLDRQWIQLSKSLDNYLSTLKEIEFPGSDPTTPAGSLLDHVQIVFGLVTSEALAKDIIMQCRVPYTIVDTAIKGFSFTILSGTLSQWRTAILNCCVDSVSIEIRQFGSRIVQELKLLKVHNFIYDLREVPMGDGSIRLIKG